MKSDLTFWLVGWADKLSNGIKDLPYLFIMLRELCLQPL